MHDDTLGELQRNEQDGEGTWLGLRKLPYLASFGVVENEPAEGDEPEDQAEMLTEIQDAMNMIQDRMSSLVGEELAQQLLREMQSLENADEEENELADEDIEEGEESEEAYRARIAQEDAWFREGLFPVVIDDREGTGPSPQQKESIKLFFANDRQFLREIMTEIMNNYREGYRSQPEWFSGLPRIKRVEELQPMVRCYGLQVSRYHVDGFAYIGLSFQCEWDQEHGLGVLWHPTRGITVGPAETAWEIEDADNLEPEAEPTIHEQLAHAVHSGDENRIQELLAAGADINAFDPKQDYPPLCVAVDQTDVAQVRRLLELGADPTKSGYDRQTPLRKARDVFKSVDLDSAKGMMRTMVQISMAANPKEHAETHEKITEIIRLLEAASEK